MKSNYKYKYFAHYKGTFKTKKTVIHNLNVNLIIIVLDFLKRMSM